MKKTNFIKGSVFTAGILAVSISLLSFCMIYGDIWQQLGISREKGSSHVRESFISGYLHYYGVKNPGALSTGTREAIAIELLPFAREILTSEAFIRQYQKFRSSAMPAEPQLKSFTKESIRKERIAETEKAIRETELNISKSAPDMAKALKPLVDMLHKNLKDYKDPESEMIEMMYQGEQMNQAATLRSYQQRQKQWLADYPERHEDFIKLRLRKFLDVAATVDFNAALKLVNGRKKFVNPSYESKAEDWKQIFRAGKEVIIPSIKFAEEWLREIDKTD